MTFKKINENKLIITFNPVELPEFANLDNLVSNTDEVKNIFIMLLDEAKERVGFDADNYTINIDAKVTLNDDVIIEVTKLVRAQNNLLLNKKNTRKNTSLKNYKSNQSTTIQNNSKLKESNTMSNKIISNKSNSVQNEIISKKLNTCQNNSTLNKQKNVSNKEDLKSNTMLSKETSNTTSKNQNKSINKNQNVNEFENNNTYSNSSCAIKVKPKKIYKNKRDIYSVYKFISFDDFINFCTFLKKSHIKINAKKISDEIKVYKYKDFYFLTLKNIDENYSKIGLFYTGITEFSTFCLNSDTLFPNLCEHGALYIPNNSIVIVEKTFC